MDDATGSGCLAALHTCWDKLMAFGPNFGHHPNGNKTWLVVSESLKDVVTGVIEGTSVHAGDHTRVEAPWSSILFLPLCGAVCVTTGQKWTAELEQLSIIAHSHPQAAYCVYSYGLKGRLYLAWTVPNISNLLQSLENTLRQRFIPDLTGRPAPSDTERELLALPARFGSLIIVNPAPAEREQQASMQLSFPLIMLITQGEADLAQSTTAQCQARNQLQQDKRKHENQAAATLPQTTTNQPSQGFIKRQD